jgi:glyoxylase-like metal-dependent hydrolase (beta-lactamase superfamily II)
VLEAPMSSGYSARIIAEAARRFPGVPVKAVITTSDAWPHIGGVREYVARGVPVYAVARTVPLLQRFLSAPRTILPDALAKAPRKPGLRLVNAKLVLGAGPNRMEIYPLRGETTERQMMVYFPEHKLLYGSDAFQKTPDGKWFYTQTISEVAAAVEREHLAVETFFMMHMGITPWQDALQALHGSQ